MTDIMRRRAQGFVLWRPERTEPAPAVLVVRFVPGSPPSEVLVVERALSRVAGFSDLWALPLGGLPLVSETVYHYWFVVARADGADGTIRVTDPFARVVDYRLGAEPAAGVFKLENGVLVDCDPDGTVGVRALSPNAAAHAPNHQLVLYEVPSSWTRGATESGVERDVGSFRDVLALLAPEEPGGNFNDVPEVAARAHLLELGVNAIELLPPADSPFRREWGYGTGNYFAGDFNLGFPEGNAGPTTEHDLRKLVARMHELGIRFFADMVMAFGYTSYRELAFDDFHIDPRREPNNSDSYQSSRNGELRDGFGGSLWRYLGEVEGYDPVSGQKMRLVPARRFMLAHLLRWLRELGLRGRSNDGESFEETVVRMIDCRAAGFADGAQAVNYITSHDVEGFENERLFLFFQNNEIFFKLERCKLAFACLLVSVGVPMILAGEEFADEHDRGLGHPDKQQDPLNFARLRDPWRRDLFDYVARLVRFRIASAALGTNDTRFIHTDFTDGRRILAWVRGVPGREDPVVVVANFSGVRPPGSEYRVPNWPGTPAGRRWREVSQARDVPNEWIGREPLFPWEAKIYALA
jgi:1,4-alpha-glucan branching enzyme